MSGLWLASYLVLWGLVVLVCLLLIGILRQLGLLQRQLALRPAEAKADSAIPALEHDGPAIGSPIVNLEAETINGFGRLILARRPERESTLLMFLSPMCETCQHVVEPLNAAAADAGRAVSPAVIMRADEHACRAFQSVFPLHLPVVCDREGTITMGLDIHRTPFGLLYDEQGTLIRKGEVEGEEDLLALLGDASAAGRAQDHVFPRLALS